MPKHKQLLLLLAAVVLVLGCRQGQKVSDQPSTQAPAASVSSAAPADVAQVVLDSVEMGKAIGPDGVSGQDTQFRQGDPLFVALDTDGISPGTTVTLRFQGPQGTVSSEEVMVPPDAEVINLKSRDTSGWAPGNYRLQVNLGDAVMGTKPFAISAG